MVDKRMLIVPAELVRKIDENRGDMNQAEFIEFLINSQLQETKGKIKEQQYVTKDELHVFEEDVKGLLRKSLDFFVSYGLELGKHSPKNEFEELTGKLQELEDDLASGGEGKVAKIKWK